MEWMQLIPEIANSAAAIGSFVLGLIIYLQGKNKDRADQPDDCTTKFDKEEADGADKSKG
ncbi:hypothetical protein [uncultured Tateyamaria sp.]|uniref:hypothetical protein n=1 Tax=uncultured Tateyamaria sp. TaxID=455651 RepID=UPI00261462CC|nr:hypothetical protein [uncultured Tateyamaria sp.]